MRAPIFPFDEHVTVFDAAEPPLEVRLPVHRFAHHQLGAPAAEAPVIGCVAEWSIEPRRRDFQRVRRRHHVLDIEHRAQVTDEHLAVIDALLLGDGDAARIAMEQHIDHLRVYILDKLSKL